MAEEPNGESDIVWGARAIAAVIGKSEPATFKMLERGHLPAKKVGDQWCASRSTLKRTLSGE